MNIQVAPQLSSVDSSDESPSHLQIGRELVRQHGALASRTTYGDGTRETLLDFTDTEPASLAFVAMPHSGAKWASFTLTVEPIMP